MSAVWVIERLISYPEYEQWESFECKVTHREVTRRLKWLNGSEKWKGDLFRIRRYVPEKEK